MANLIIKPTSGGSLILQDEGGTAAHTIDANGNHTLSGTTNNIGTVTAGTISTGATIASGVHGKYFLKEHQQFHYTTATTLTNTTNADSNICGSNYITIAVGPTTDLLEFNVQYNTERASNYIGHAIERATDSGFSANSSTLWASGKHSTGAGSNQSDEYAVVHYCVIDTAADLGLSANTTYYFRAKGRTHTVSGTMIFGPAVTSHTRGDGVRMSCRHWTLVP